MIINLFNPQQIVISGMITEASNVVFPVIQRCVENQSLKILHQNLLMVASSLSSTPTLGAFALVKYAMLNGALLQRLLKD